MSDGQIPPTGHRKGQPALSGPSSGGEGQRSCSLEIHQLEPGAEHVISVCQTQTTQTRQLAEATGVSSSPQPTNLILRLRRSSGYRPERKRLFVVKDKDKPGQARIRASSVRCVIVWPPLLPKTQQLPEGGREGRRGADRKPDDSCSGAAGAELGRRCSETSAIPPKQDALIGCYAAPSWTKRISNSIKVHVKAVPATSKPEQHASTRAGQPASLPSRGHFLFPLNLRIQEGKKQKKVGFYD